MKVRALAALVVLAASSSACQPGARPEPSPEDTAAAAVGVVDPAACAEPGRNASVRGVTGTFATAEEAARSVEALPDDGVLVPVRADAASAVFRWVRHGDLLFVIDTHRGEHGWTVGSYVQCVVPS